jgi:hypothetical protein
MKPNLIANLVLNWICLVLSFLECLQPIIDVTMCTIIINVIEIGEFNIESPYFIPLFNKISWLWGQKLGGDETSNEGCNLGPTRHDFMDNSIVFGFDPK